MQIYCRTFIFGSITNACPYCFFFAGGQGEASGCSRGGGYVWHTIQNGAFRDSAQQGFKLLQCYSYKM